MNYRWKLVWSGPKHLILMVFVFKRINRINCSGCSTMECRLDKLHLITSDLSKESADTCWSVSGEAVLEAWLSGWRRSLCPKWLQRPPLSPVTEWHPVINGWLWKSIQSRWFVKRICFHAIREKPASHIQEESFPQMIKLITGWIQRAACKLHPCISCESSGWYLSP